MEGLPEAKNSGDSLNFMVEMPARLIAHMDRRAENAVRHQFEVLQSSARQRERPGVTHANS